MTAFATNHTSRWKRGAVQRSVPPDVPAAASRRQGRGCPRGREDIVGQFIRFGGLRERGQGRGKAGEEEQASKRRRDGGIHDLLMLRQEQTAAFREAGPSVPQIGRHVSTPTLQCALKVKPGRLHKAAAW